MNPGINPIERWLAGKGFLNWREVHYQEPTVSLMEQALTQGLCDAKLAANGALRVRDIPSYPGRKPRTGRSPADKFIVRDEVSTGEGQEVYFGDVNRPISEEVFDHLQRHLQTYLQQREVWVQDSFAGAHPDYRIGIRFITDAAWMALFAKTLLVRPAPGELKDFEPGWTVVNACNLQVRGAADGVKSDAFAAISFKRRMCIIGGLSYGGEIKKSVFTILNWVMPTQKGVFPMHCAANVDRNRRSTCLFFGLSGTGKTTLSASPRRRLIGDDEHGWAPGMVFNFEGGCYAKCLDLTREREPQIWDAIRFGSIMENVVLGHDREPDYADGGITRNTRVTYPVEHIPNCVVEGMGPEPSNIIFLTCDAFGVLPPIAMLEPPQAMYHFLSGFTSKLAGTEAGIEEPVPTFSACFGAPFMPLHPSRYGQMLKEAMERSGARAWLVNTGWVGGTAATGSKRISIRNTRNMVNAIVEGHLKGVEFSPDPVWNVLVPGGVPGCPRKLLYPSMMWADKDAYEQQARKLVSMFQENFEKYHDFVEPEVIEAGPREF